MEDGNKQEVEDRYRKHTLLWKPGDWERVEQAAKALGEQAHVEVSPPDFIRGTVLRRVDELIGPPEPAQPAA